MEMDVDVIDRVAAAFKTAPRRDGGYIDHADLARIAVAAVFDALAEPTSAAREAGNIDIAATCDECPNHTYSLGSFEVGEVWAKMLAAMRNEALG
jgi:DNA-binding IscR family transcriptional regulator